MTLSTPRMDYFPSCHFTEDIGASFPFPRLTSFFFTPSHITVYIAVAFSHNTVLFCCVSLFCALIVLHSSLTVVYLHLCIVMCCIMTFRSSVFQLYKGMTVKIRLTWLLWFFPTSQKNAFRCSDCSGVNVCLHGGLKWTSVLFFSIPDSRPVFLRMSGEK